MQKIKWITVLVVWLAAENLGTQVNPPVVNVRDVAPLDTQREKPALQVPLEIAEKLIINAVDAMPADKFGFAPPDGGFKGVPTFGQMVKHLSATKHILAAAVLGGEAAADAGDEVA